MPDLPDVLSPIDGTVIHGRAGMREHMKQHNVTNVADYTNTWKEAERERARFYTGDPSYDSKRRTEHLRQAFEKHEQTRRRR